MCQAHKSTASRQIHDRCTCNVIPGSPTPRRAHTTVLMFMQRRPLASSLPCFRTDAPTVRQSLVPSSFLALPSVTASPHECSCSAAKNQAFGSVQEGAAPAGRCGAPVSLCVPTPLSRAEDERTVLHALPVAAFTAVGRRWVLNPGCLLPPTSPHTALCVGVASPQK